jgi:hypothetical protein
MLWVTTGIGFCLILVRGLRGECAEGRYPGRIWVQPPLQRSLLTYGLRLGLPQIAAMVAVQALLACR